jgi:hypothetical protein
VHSRRVNVTEVFCLEALAKRTSEQQPAALATTLLVSTGSMQTRQDAVEPVRRFRLRHSDVRWCLRDRDQINLAAEIRQKTSARALVLHAPTFNSPIFLTGRRSLLGYAGWAWSRGLDYTEREDKIRRIYRGNPDVANLMRREHIDYVMIGPLERVSLSANEAFFSHYVKVAECGAYRLYKVSSD